MIEYVFNFFDLYISHKLDSAGHSKIVKWVFAYNFWFLSQPHPKFDKRLTHFFGIDFAGPQILGFYVYCASFICMLPIKLVSLCLCILNCHNYVWGRMSVCTLSLSLSLSLSLWWPIFTICHNFHNFHNFLVWGEVVLKFFDPLYHVLGDF